MSLFVSCEDIAAFTNKARYSAQARVLDGFGIRYTRRPDGSIALRQEELDAHTLTRTQKAKAKRDWRPDLSVIDRPG